MSAATSACHGNRLTIATILRPEGSTGVHTHIRQLRGYLRRSGKALPSVVTPYSWGAIASPPVFAVRLILKRLGPAAEAASVLWYYHWHEQFLRRALRRHLAGAGEVVIYAQEPRAARAALHAREGPHQRVVMAVHFLTSQADEWVDKGALSRGGQAFQAIRRFEAAVTPNVDGIVYVSEMAQDALLAWLPAAGAVDAAVIPNFVDPVSALQSGSLVGDLVTVGGLERAKNHTYLLEVLATAKSKGRSYTLDIFGTGPMRRHLEDMCRTLGLVRQVRFRGFSSDVRFYLPGFRAYVHASLRESQSLAIIEAQAAGLPVIAGDVGGVRSVCDGSSGARFWPLDDAETAAAILIDLLDDDHARRTAAAAARERFHQHFHSDIVAPRLISFLFGDHAHATASQPAP